MSSQVSSGFMLTLLKQANFKLITRSRILPCWILAGCFCKLWKINVKYADVFCLKQMFGPSCQNPISCSPGGLPPTTLSQSSLEAWRGDQNSTLQAFEEFWTWRSLLKRIKNRNIPFHTNQMMSGEGCWMLHTFLWWCLIELVSMSVFNSSILLIYSSILGWCSPQIVASAFTPLSSVSSYKNLTLGARFYNSKVRGYLITVWLINHVYAAMQNNSMKRPFYWCITRKQENNNVQGHIFYFETSLLADSVIYLTRL